MSRPPARRYREFASGAGDTSPYLETVDFAVVMYGVGGSIWSSFLNRFRPVLLPGRELEYEMVRFRVSGVEARRYGAEADGVRGEAKNLERASGLMSRREG